MASTFVEHAALWTSIGFDVLRVPYQKASVIAGSREAGAVEVPCYCRNNFAVPQEMLRLKRDERVHV